jgi:hypothetical protein
MHCDPTRPPLAKLICGAFHGGWNVVELGVDEKWPSQLGEAFDAVRGGAEEKL